METNRDPGLHHTAGTRVTVELDWNALDRHVEVALFDGGVRTSIVDRSEAWREGALYGVRYALETANSLPCGVRIKEICGERCKTNPTIVAAAAAHAIWEALEFSPPKAVSEDIERAVRESQGRRPDYLATFCG